MIKIVEIFDTIQGEGIFSGVPSVFVRTSGCNLRCVWCDTPYASWNPEGEKMTVDAIINRVLHYRSKGHVVITGGEPMIVKEMPELVTRLNQKGMTVTIETAGTIYNEAVMPTLFSISPKLANSEPLDDAKALRLHRRNNRFDGRFLSARHGAQIKFVVQSVDDMPEINDFITTHNIPHDKVYLMPEGQTPEELALTTPAVAEICKLTGFKLSARIHIMIYGKQRGV